MSVEDSFQWWDGDHLHTDTEDFMDTTLEVQRAMPIKLKESIYSRLVLENTKDLLEGLDEEALLKLKKLVDDKLKSL